MIDALAPSEGLIMTCLWDSEEELTVSECVERLKNIYEREYAANTVTTFLKILERKGFVHRYKIKGAHQYKVLISKEEYLDAQSRQTRNRWFGGSSYASIASYIKTSDGIDPEDVVKLKELLDEYSN